MLALVYHLGAGTATAQAPGNPIVAAEGGFGYASNGDDYMGGGPTSRTTWFLLGNVFSGAAVPARHEPWSQLKARYR